MTTELIHPDDIEPLHTIEDVALYELLVESMWREGWTGRPLLVAECGGKLRGLTGSHRTAAAKCTGTHVPSYVVTMTEDQLARATAEFQDTRLAVIQETGDAEAIALFERELKEGR